MGTCEPVDEPQDDESTDNQGNPNARAVSGSGDAHSVAIGERVSITRIGNAWVNTITGEQRVCRPLRRKGVHGHE